MKNFLIISTTGMGDTLWGTPAIRAIKKALPRAGVDLLLQPQWESLFYGNNNIRRLIPYYPHWYRQIIRLPKFLGTRYDHVFFFTPTKILGEYFPGCDVPRSGHTNNPTVFRMFHQIKSYGLRNRRTASCAA